jgi:hypothetical protein
MPLQNLRRRVGLERAGDLGLGAEVKRSGAANALKRIHFGVSKRLAQDRICRERLPSMGWRNSREARSSYSQALSISGRLREFAL